MKEKLQGAITHVVEAVQEDLDSRLRRLQDQLTLTDEEKQSIDESQERVSDPNSLEHIEYIDNQIRRISVEVFRDYLSTLATDYIPDTAFLTDDVDEYIKNNIRVLKITKYVVDNKEKSIDKLKNAYNVLSGSACNVALVFNRTPRECNVYLVVGNTEIRNDPNDTKRFYKSLKAAFNGNFPGTSYLPLDGDERIEQNASIELSKVLQKAIASVDISSVSAITNIAAEKSADFVSQGIEKLIDGFVPKTSDESYTLILLAEPKKAHEIDELKKHYGALYTVMSPFSVWQKNYSYAETVALMKSASGTGGLQLGVDKIVKVGISGSLGYTGGKTRSYTGTESLTLTHTIYDVKNTLDRIERQVARLAMCEGLGMWDFAAYVLSKDYSVTNNISNMYRSLTQGEDSYIQKATINIWDNAELNGDERRKASFVALKNSLSFFRHPRFTLTREHETLPQQVKATTNLSGTELAYAMNLPNRSVSGLPVIECAEFGRDVLSYDMDYTGSINVGCIYHMHQEEKAKRVSLNKNSLTAHTFITGSTGSGKSNTIFKLLKEIIKDGKTKFLVIEPAKGEYKNVFGKTARTYGTNPSITELITINPFSFPKNIHVLEHLDRLIEIFNVCWPMYAAMPAILKDAVERAYEGAGWDLAQSVNKYDERIFPTFDDVLKKIRVVLRESEYSADNKGDYIGALVTRLKSLTNGINGQIFSPNALTDAELFEENVIVDLSRVGSTETKALIMGLLVMKLQEYRLASSSPDQKELRHVTVLEEAHNLLRRTSTEQSSDRSNLLGKAVEMLANSIAEMRSFGEGFIIADQSPGLLDMSVIRNTNTKVILRLPDFSDRELVGKAAGLNNEQIIELSKLQRGVAAFYQNDWISPVLCKVDEFTEKESYSPKKTHLRSDEEAIRNLIEIIMNGEVYRKVDKENILRADLPTDTKCLLMEYLSATREERLGVMRRKLANSLFDSADALEKAKNCTEVGQWERVMLENIKPALRDYSEEETQKLLALIMSEQASLNSQHIHHYSEYMRFVRLGGLR